MNTETRHISENTHIFIGGNDGYSDNKGGAGVYGIEQKYTEIRGAN